MENTIEPASREQLKIIAIRPLKKCKLHLLRALHIGQIYYFNKKYSINEYDVCSYTGREEDVLPYNFFSSSNHTNTIKSPLINLNAIVGKNGDGKSSLVELYIRIINNLAHEIFHKDEDYEGHAVKGLYAELFFSIERTNISETNSTIARQFYRISIKGDNVTIAEQCLPKDIIRKPLFSPFDINKELLSKLYYSIVVNYSIFAYNVYDFCQEWEEVSDYKSCWLHNLFHKNDGYQLPIVLHPFRDRGNTNINTENSLVKSRLIALFIEPRKDQKFNLRVINDKQTATAISCEFIESKKPLVGINNKYVEIKEEWDEILKQEREYAKTQEHMSSKNINNTPFQVMDFSILEKNILKRWSRLYGIPFKTIYQEEKKAKMYQAAKEYLVYKTIVVSRQYKLYSRKLALLPTNTQVRDDQYFDRLLKDLITLMSNDTSHITLKIKQTLSFLKFQIDTWNIINKAIPLDTLYDNIKKVATTDNKRHKWEIIDLLPAPIFNTEIILFNNQTKREERFSALSSGERQLIYCVSSILYHLRNLNSVQANLSYAHYSHVNLILEEIELYFHPEFQRRFIKYLLDSIKNINLNEIESINIIFVTHSPFVLSDIPISNVLFLEKGFPVSKMQENTFGANINNLYKNSFFLDSMPIGEFAMSKIQGLFARLQDMEATPDLRKEIKLVGEPLLKSQLLKQYNENLPGSYYAVEIEKMQGELERIKNHGI